MANSVMSDVTTVTADDAAARLVVELSLNAVDADALAAARLLMQDQLAVQIGCAELPWSVALAELTRASHSPGNAHVTVYGDAMHPADACFVNASFGHGFEYDDAHSASTSHPGSTVVSAAIALGEELDSTLGEVLLGIVAGYEVYTRIGVMATPDTILRGFHPHAQFAPFGAAAVVAKMRGYDFEETRNALAIAMSHCAGTTEYTSSGGSVKRVHAGIGTRNGIRAAELAAAGITGPSAYLSGAKGFFRTIAGREIPVDAADRLALDAPFEITRVWTKAYCCCGYIHCFIDAARMLHRDPGDIERIDLQLPAGGNRVVGTENQHAYAPQLIEQLQYALPFQVALSALGLGNGLSTHLAYLNGELDLGPDTAVSRLAQRVHMAIDPELETQYPGKLCGRLAVTYTDGTTETYFVENATGTPDNPFTDEVMHAKFADLTVATLGIENSEKLRTLIASADLDRPVTEISALLRTNH